MVAVNRSVGVADRVPVPSSTPAELIPIDLDSARETFLDDHRVNDIPLLPTVMGTDALVWAALAGQPSPQSVEIRDLQVGPPVLFDHGPRRRLAVRTLRVGPKERRTELLSGTDPATVHFAARVSIPAAGTPASRRRHRPCDARSHPVRGAQVYPPYFHGPRLQVIGAAAITADGVVARLAAGMPPARWATRETVTAPTLLELGLQACGLWELAHTGRMMIPSRLERVLVAVPESHLGDQLPAAEARVKARSELGEETGRQTTFDGVVVDEDGRVLVEFSGYHTVDLGGRVSEEHRAPLRAERPMNRVGR